MTPKDQLDEGVKTAQRQIDEKFAGNSQMKLQAEVQLYGNNPVKNKQWETLLASAPGAASTAILAGNTSLPPSLAKGLALYRDLSAASPGALAKHVDKKSQDFFETALVAQRLGYAPDDNSALALAARAADNKAEIDGATRRDIQDKATSSLKGTVFNGLGNMNNSAQPINDVVALATTLHKAMGLTADEAVKQAIPSVQSKYVQVNGNAVYTGGKEVPKEFDTLASAYVKDFYTRNEKVLKAQGIDLGDLTIQSPNTNTPNWVIHGAHGQMIPFAVKGRSFSPFDLGQKAQSLATMKATADQFALDHRYDPWIQLGDAKTGISVGPLFPGGMTKAQEAEVQKARERVAGDHATADAAVSSAVTDVMSKDTDQLRKNTAVKGATTFTKSGVDLPEIDRNPAEDAPLLEAWDPKRRK